MHTENQNKQQIGKLLEKVYKLIAVTCQMVQLNLYNARKLLN